MLNPWLNVPLADYEGHMQLPDVAQLGALSDLFAEALAMQRPASVAILGVAGGNGLDRIDRSVTNRVVGIDINAAYLDTVRERCAGIELHCVDLAEDRLRIPPADLVHAALILEHADVHRCLDNAVALSSEALSVVLQLPSATTHGVAPTPYESMRNLASHFKLIDPAWLRATLADRGFPLAYETRRSLPAGKAFWMGVFTSKTPRRSTS